MAKFYSLNWQDFFDELFDNDYPTSEHNISGNDCSIIIKEEDKEKLLDELSLQFRQILENIIEEVDDEEVEDENEG